MSSRCPDLPFLPGYTFNPNIGRTKFNVDPKFDFIGEGNMALVEKVKPNMFGPLSDKYPSIYPRGESIEIPGWIAFDKQILCFDGFFQETLQEVRGSPFQIRKVKIYIFLEDGTIQVVEPRVENSGVAQGTLISRQRIRFPPPMDDNFYDFSDFNIGREVELYGRVFKITNCDRFTRTFLNRCGIAIPDPIVAPPDPYMEIRSHQMDAMQPKKPNRTVDTLGKFLQNDKKVLHFKGYWDDKETEFGYVHHLGIRYYLADDTIEIKELQVQSSDEPGFIFLRRGKLPQIYKELPSPGHNSNYTVLNVLGSALSSRRYIIDPLDCGRHDVNYYTEKDLSIGAILNCYGRKIVLTDCDSFTSGYYAEKYGISEFTPLDIPNDVKNYSVDIPAPKQRELPPWNGFGTHEDSAQNCITVEPKAPHKDFKKFLAYDRIGLDSHILRFEARMKSKIPENCSRIFIIRYYLSDDTMGIFEVAKRNSGFHTSSFLARNKIILPEQKVFTSKPPLSYTPQHMFIGATLIINGFEFVLLDADEYALRYMELNASQFPKANIKIIMDKVKEKLRPIYKDFVAENLPTETPVISFERLRAKLCELMGPSFTEHEMVTISRAFSAVCYKEVYNRDKIRALALTELKRFLWDDLDRLKEYFLQRDATRSGKLTKKDCYIILKACRLPFDKELIERILQVSEPCKRVRPQEEERRSTRGDRRLEQTIGVCPDDPRIGLNRLQGVRRVSELPVGVARGMTSQTSLPTYFSDAAQARTEVCGGGGRFSAGVRAQGPISCQGRVQCREGDWLRRSQDGAVRASRALNNCAGGNAEYDEDASRMPWEASFLPPPPLSPAARATRGGVERAVRVVNNDEDRYYRDDDEDAKAPPTRAATRQACHEE